MPDLIAGLIDVFADEPLTGNPLAVVQATDELSEERMRQLAGEFNQAETTFILESTRADRKLRSFTASGAEIFGAGHNALGAWLWLGEHGDLGPLTTPLTFYQEIGTDVLSIELEKIGARVHGRMRQAPLRLLPRWAMWIRWRRRSGSIHAKSCLSQHRARCIPVSLICWCGL
jgi:PhzF family phenazine biosynthesis protein